ncbi:MAG: ATP-binding cassette domain-containing protein, partial [Deltaproteobacteria bacterium]|nr:ATP-binding cassette domain-containing protein [Deltaproteobacteria bacterium]
MLELKNLKTSYGQSQVLFGVYLQVNEREVVTLLGRNGMGKTTTINSIMGMVRARSGEISFEGNQIREWPAYRVAQSGMGLVPEGRQIFPNLNVIENLVATSANRFKNKNPW